MAHAGQYVDQGRFQSDLAALVAHPTESQNPDARPELLRYLQLAMQPRLQAAGAPVKDR